MHPNDKNKKVDSSVTLCKFGCNVSISPLFERLFHKNHLARVRRTSRFGLKYKQWLEMSGSLLKKHPFCHQKHSCKCVHVAFKLFSGVTLTNPETQIQIAPNLQPRCLSLTSHQKLINTYKRKKNKKQRYKLQFLVTSFSVCPTQTGLFAVSSPGERALTLCTAVNF